MGDTQDDRAGTVRNMNDELACAIRNARRVLVITNCTARKAVDIEKVKKVLKDHGLPFPSFDLGLEEKYREVLRPFVRRASEMYTGQLFRAVRGLVDALRGMGKEVDLYIVSARYGLIRDDHEVVPYDATLRGKGRGWVRAWSTELSVEEKLDRAIREGNHDLVLLVLSKDYAVAVEGVIYRLVDDPRAILVVPRSVLKKVDSAKAKIISVKGIGTKTKIIKELWKAINGKRHG